MPRSLRLLLIDDDRLQHRLVEGMTKIFRGDSCELDTADNYAAGLKKLLSGKYAACILDYQLGERDGLMLLREAKTAGCETPVIMLTSDTRDEVDLAALVSMITGVSHPAAFASRSSIKPSRSPSW